MYPSVYYVFTFVVSTIIGRVLFVQAGRDCSRAQQEARSDVRHRLYRSPPKRLWSNCNFTNSLPRPIQIYLFEIKNRSKVFPLFCLKISL